MSDAKLASTHPRKARNTQLVKDPDTASDAKTEALTARLSVVFGWFQASPFQATNPYYRGQSRCQGSGSVFWETTLTPPEKWAGGPGRKGPELAIRPSSLGTRPWSGPGKG